MPRRIESLFVPGPVGRLEALLEEPEHSDPTEAALVCHPHPQHGGTLHNKVVYRTARGLRAQGAVVLRFNYRGVNLSEGAYDNGIGEIDDARAALQLLRSRYPALPFTLAGFSFGSRIALRLGQEFHGARRLIAVGFPSRYFETEIFPAIAAPRQFVLSTHDEHCPLEVFNEGYATIPEPKSLHLIEARDHFFAGALEQLELTVRALGSSA
ncbi:MAG: alpha/beta hydrolase [Bryobacterales bacterium]|nr:alpha/beta hydrolase [Bryobacterales bacterium]